MLTLAAGSFPCLRAYLHLERRLRAYILSTFLPSLLVVLLSWVSFWIDLESVPARISLGILTMLTITTQSSVHTPPDNDDKTAATTMTKQSTTTTDSRQSSVHAPPDNDDRFSEQASVTIRRQRRQTCHQRQQIRGAVRTTT